MQDLIRKKNDLIKKKKTLLGTFFVNLAIIIMLISNSIPVNIYLKIFLVGILSILEGFISKKLKYTRKDIKKINNKINCLKELEIIDKEKSELEKIKDTEYKLNEAVLNNEILYNDEKEKNNIKVKKKIL